MDIGIGIAGLLGGVWGVKIAGILVDARKKSGALREIILGNELFKYQNQDAAADFKKAHINQSAATKNIVDRDKVPLEEWIAVRRPILPMAALMGPTMHLFLIMLAGVFNKLDWYLWFALVFGTCWGLMVLTVRAAIDRKLAARLAKGA